MRIKFERNRGITLIALIITIVLLLILAGVGIAMLTGENGILSQAQEAKEQTAYKSAEEKVNLAIMGARADDGQMTIEELKKEVGYQGGSVAGDAFPAEVEMDGYTFVVEETGKVTNKEDDENKPIKGITASDIANASDKSIYYGAIVKGYELPSTTVTDVGWKIFYADESNIYLIADNYVERANLPNSTTEAGVVTANKPTESSEIYPRAAYFDNVLGDYVTGSARITDKKLKKLNNTYFYKIENGQEVDNFASTNNNMKAVAYMMDTNAWNSKFKDINNKAEYVIGGPTIEMVMKSYSQKYGVDYRAEAANAIGYKISKDGGENWENVYSEILDTSDNLYVLNIQTGANAMWVASPAVNDTNDIFDVNYNGTLDNYNYSNGSIGFRPLVCLKLDVQLQKNEDETYSII